MYKILLMVMAVTCFGCTSTKEVNRFATTAQQSLDKFNSVNYSFGEFCQNDCELQQMRSGQIDPNVKCACVESSDKADDAIQKIHQTIVSYLEALEALSNNASFDADVSGLDAALQSSGILNLTPKQVSVVNKAGNFITNAATTFYRKRKLSQYIGEADTLFQDLMSTYIFLATDRLQEQLSLEHDISTANNRQMLENSSADAALKQFIIREQIRNDERFNQHSRLIKSYRKTLEKVQLAHHTLYLERNRLNKPETKAMIRDYIKSLKIIVTEIKALHHSTT